jgi:hypothetical protein
MEVDYSLPGSYTRITQQTFNINVVNCNSIDLIASGQWVVSGAVGYRQLWFFASVRNPSSACPVANVTGEVDEAGFPLGQPFTRIGTFSLPAYPNRLNGVWSSKLLDEYADPTTFNFFMTTKPLPKWKTVITSASVSDPNTANNQCSIGFSTNGFSGTCP